VTPYSCITTLIPMCGCVCVIRVRIVGGEAGGGEGGEAADYCLVTSTDEIPHQTRVSYRELQPARHMSRKVFNMPASFPLSAIILPILLHAIEMCMSIL
jgi:hypothetical protein